MKETYGTKKKVLEFAAGAACMTLSVISCTKDGNNNLQNLPSESPTVPPPMEEKFDNLQAIEQLNENEEAPPPQETQEIEITTTPTPIEIPPITLSEANRTSCDIRGTDYLSITERDWFRANCPSVLPTRITATQPPARPNAQPTPVPAPRAPQPPAPISPSSGTGEIVTLSYYYCSQTVPLRKGDDGGGYCANTASGQRPISGQTAACGPRWSFGDELYLEAANRTVICNDRGGAVKGNHIDVYFQTNGEAYNSGLPTSSPVRVLR